MNREEAEQVQSPLEPGSALDPFETIGGYKIQAELGGSGRTRVFYAVDAETGAEVAIKLLPQDFFDDPEFKKQFELEILALAELDVDTIVPVYHMGEEQGRPFLVQRYMPGGTLADRLMAGPLKLQDVITITLRLAIALDAAHQAGVVHRNLKLSNVLFDERSQAYLSDFCQVKRSQMIGTQVVNWLDGAPTTMSPEQALGREDVDYRSDVYSLGALVYEMLAGQPPFPGSNPVTQAGQQVYSAPHDLRRLRPSLPVGCAAAVEWAMSKDPAFRYRSAGEFALVFEQQAVHPKLYTTQSRAVRRRLLARKLFLSLLTVLLALFGAGFFLSWNYYLPDPYNIHSYLDRLVVTPLAPTTPAPSRTPAPTATRPPPTSTPKPTATQTPIPTTPMVTPNPTGTPFTMLAAGGPVLGFADKIAVIASNDIWIANLDGSDLVQVTSDHAAKDDLQWTPDGQALTYRQGECYKILYMNGSSEHLGCFDDLEFSPDMQQMVIAKKVTLEGNRNKQWLNFIFSYDHNLISMVDHVPQQPIYGGCPFVGGFQLKFSPFEDTMAAVFSPDMGRTGYEVSVYRRRACGENLDFLADFPTYRFTIRGPLGTSSKPTIQDFGWDGSSLFALHGDYLHGYGEMVIYNMELGRSNTLYPVQGKCCYQDIQWSPDGSYLLFVYQNSEVGTGAQVYYIPYTMIANLINTRDYSNKKGEGLQPIPFPSNLFSLNIDQRIEPALRQAIP